ncbi:RBBP8 N-terminal-like protein [Microtus ochrogaster]|uniref:RBBP8 N-terminal-like protein n=1 Tax=Microtus ochrogaster TaxID=79684 RepID=A0A8J6GQY6_MICOH|nr:RBBP8 N-terminal-like protein [Microtus ochrogaster]
MGWVSVSRSLERIPCDDQGRSCHLMPQPYLCCGKHLDLTCTCLSSLLGLQNKLLELNSERCRDAQRIEELFAKNHQLREQQKALKENLRVLENRLRAGLCDRCMVTQELARKKQLELESAHLQSLQHLCILTNEMNGLREENKILKEEMKLLRSLRDKAAPQAWEGSSEATSPMPQPSPGNLKGAPENPPGDPEEAEEEQPGTDKVSSHKTSPVARISPAANLPEPRALDMSPQCISNQLHSTVAVVRPGSRACPPDSGTANGTPPPPTTRSSPPSPPYEHGLPVDSFLRASRPSALAYETLKRSLQTDRLCLLNRHLSLHLQSPHRSPPAPATAAKSPLLQGLKTREAEAWEEPGALMGIQDPRLEGALHLLLVQQQLRARARARAGSARLRVPSTQENMPSSPPAVSDSESSEKPSKVRAQRPEPQQLEESDIKMGLTSEASTESSMPGERQAEGHQQGPQQKRKRTSDLQDKVKPSDLKTARNSQYTEALPDIQTVCEAHLPPRSLGGFSPSQPCSKMQHTEAGQGIGEPQSSRTPCNALTSGCNQRFQSLQKSPGQEEAVSGAPLWSMSKCSQQRGKGEGIVTSGELREEYEQ